MADREKVIKGLECLSSAEVCNGSDCPYYDFDCTQKIAYDALELLKEQEPVFVGCSDCKHYGYHDMTNQDGFCYCMKRHEYLSPDFFCADWEGGGNN